MSLSELANAIRFLSIDAVENAQSGHPGMPLGMADIATVLWKKFFKHNPANPKWANRDRFILSNGHGSMLLYALLHLTGYELSINDLKQFRQLHSKTPGHPEYGYTPGVETSTGPLGQGLANAVGMAIAEQTFSAQFNKENLELINHFTYTFVGDGCLMEGISHEVCSLAGTLQLGKLIVFYDDNGISIDGPVRGWFTEDVAERFKAYQWQVVGPIDGYDHEEIENAIKTAQLETQKPTLIICKTIIGYQSLQANSEKSHGSPLGKDSIAKVREGLQWIHIPFEIPESIYVQWNKREQGEADENAWNSICKNYQQKNPIEYKEFLRRTRNELPKEWEELSQSFIENCYSNSPKEQATRKSSQVCLETFGKYLPELLGGSADLTGSNNTAWSGSKTITSQDFTGNYIFYGVREFGMAAIMNGLALYGGIIPYGGTFLVFSDYARNAIRLSALMQQRVIYVLTHDSIGLGEDGPTHQPVEHASMLRMTPNVEVWRPADLIETAIAWQQAIENFHSPSALLLSRQNLPTLPHSPEQAELIKKGGYIIKDSTASPEIILIATGSEVHLALSAAKVLEQEGRNIRVVSMPCCELFLAQDQDYQEQVLPKTIRGRIAVEAAATSYWYRFVGLDGKVIGLDQFGVSAPAEEAYAYFGITVDAILSAANQLINSLK